MRSIYKYFYFLFVFAFLFFTGCKKENRCDCIKRTGDIIKETRHIEGFKEIFVEDNVNVFISQDTVFEITVEAGENIVPLIKTNVEDGILYIRNKNRCNWTRSYKKPLNVYVHMPKISYITSDGTGVIKSENAITTDTLDVMTKNSGDIELIVNNQRVITHMHGSGDITLHGATMQHYCSIGGTAYLYASEMQTNYTYIHTFTLGQCNVRVTGQLDCRIDDEGDLNCYGNPSSIQKIRNGSGDLYLK